MESPPFLRPLRKRPANRRRASKGGQRVTFIAGGGKSLTRNGPYKGVAWEGAPAADKAFLQSLGKLASGQGKSGTTLGAVRGGAKPDPDDPWALDVNRAGDYCVAADAPVVL